MSSEKVSVHSSMINAFDRLGLLFRNLGSSSDWPGFDSGLNEDEYVQFEELIKMNYIHNAWFNESNIRQSLLSLGEILKKDELNKWLNDYSINEDNKSHVIAIIMAGNIPLVGFHDLLCVLLSGNKALVKLSSNDKILLPKVLEVLNTFDPVFSEKVIISQGKLEGFDKVIATGSNNTSRYFDSYFGKYPNIIRKNRNSIAIITGNESEEEIKKLGSDIFSYFGLGCRSISKIYIPEEYDLDTFFKGIFDFGDIVNHNKYANNYDYNKAVWLLNGDDILDNGFILLKKSELLTAPTASLYYERYTDMDSLKKNLENIQEEIQCIVSHSDIPFGDSQKPSLNDYADNVDTLKFLLG